MNIKKRAVKKVNPEFRSCISAGINKLYHYKCRRVRMLKKKEHFKHATKLSRINTYYICRIMFKWCCLWASIKPGTGNIPEHEKSHIPYLFE